MKVALCLLLFTAIIASVLASAGNKILIWPGSQNGNQRYLREIASELASNDYNVTMVMPEETRQLEISLPDVKIVHIPAQSIGKIAKAGYYKGVSGSDIDGWVSVLKNEAFDLLVMELVLEQKYLPNLFGIDNVLELDQETIEYKKLSAHYRGITHSSYPSDTHPPYSDYLYPTEQLGKYNFWNRFRSYLSNLFSDFTQQNLHLLSSYKDDGVKRLVLTYGVEGIMNQMSVPKNLKFVYPWVNLKNTKHLDVTTSSFLSRFSTVFVVEDSRDTNFLKALLNFAIAHQNIGFVVETQEPIQSKLDNLLVQSSLELDLILKTGSILFTFSGQKSFLEGLESGVPIVTLLQQRSQHVCQAIKDKNVGLCLDSFSDTLFEKALKLLGDPEVNQNVAQMQKAVQRQSKNKYDVVYWTNYIFNVGIEHLQNERFQTIGYLAQKDIDIVFSYYFIALTLFLLVYFICNKIYRCLSSMLTHIFCLRP